MPGDLYRIFIQPRSQDEDTRRREFILNILLLGTLGLLVVAIGLLVVVALAFKREPAMGRADMLVIVLLLLTLLFVLSRVRFYRLAAYLFVAGYLLIGLSLFARWGLDLPQGFLVLCLSLIMSSVLLGTRSSFVVMVLIGVGLLILTHLINRDIIRPDLGWVHEPVMIYDTIGFIFVFVVMTLVAWLSNREIDQSLRRARRSEAELKRQRDSLEVMVDERTKDLKQAQLEKVSQLYRLAEFGKLTSGLFHDLANPLSLVLLNFDRLNSLPQSESVKRVAQGIRQIEHFVKAAQKQIKHQEEYRTFSIVHEVEEVIGLMRHKLKSQGVSVVLTGAASIRLFGNLIKFIQVVTNLMSNAIDAYDRWPSVARRPIEITVSEHQRIVTISFADHGRGIPAEHLSKVFEPFFTTKDVEHGTGIGLSISQGIVKKDFHGLLTVASQVGQGSTFTLSLPVQSAPGPAEKVI